MRYFITSLFFLLMGLGVYAQDTTGTDSIVEAEQAAEPEKVAEPSQKSSAKDKIYYGGYVNFTLGSYTSIGIEPMVGYKITPKLSAGIKIRYDYISDRRYSETHTTSNYGGSLFTRLRLFRGLYLHAEYAGYNYELYDESGNSERDWIPFLFVGAGFSKSLGGRASLNAQILFDVHPNSKSPYRKWEPFYSVGIGVGF